jgi:hypothetical protein
MACTDCGRKPAQDGYDVCFRCRVLSVGTVWRGGGHLYGRDNFSSRTNAEYVREHVGDTTGLAHLGSGDWQG